MENFGVKIFQNVFQNFPKLGKNSITWSKKIPPFFKKYFFIGETCEGTNRSKIKFLVAYFIPNKEFFKWPQEKTYTCVNIVKNISLK